MNRQIRQHPLGVPQLGDHFVFQSEADHKTYKAVVDPYISGMSTNFEWNSADAALGEYDLDEIVTRSGNFYQSTIDNNPNTPGVDATWTLLTQRFSWQLWAAGVYAGDEIFVLKIVSDTVFIYRLDNAARPYNSVDFNTELEAGDWVQVARLEEIEVDTTGADIDLDMLRLHKLSFLGSDQVAGNKNVNVLNDLVGNEFLFLLDIDAAGRELTFEADTRHRADDGNWNPGTRVWVSPSAGIFLIWGRRINELWLIEKIDTNFI